MRQIRANRVYSIPKFIQRKENDYETCSCKRLTAQARAADNVRI